MKVIFVAGSSRTGTTLMARTIGNHYDAIKLEELHFFDELYKSGKLSKADTRLILSELNRRYMFGYFSVHNNLCVDNCNCNSANAISLFFEFLKFVSNDSGKSIVVEQTPSNIFYLPEIISGGENVKIIIMLRDPRDVVVSQKYKWMRRFKGGTAIPLKETIRAFFNYNPIIISYIWKKCYDKPLKSKGLFNDQCIIVKYEEFVEHPKEILEDIFNAFDLSWDNNVLNVEAVGSSSHKDGAKKGFVKDNINKWEYSLNLLEIAIVENINFRVMRLFGYNKSIKGIKYLIFLCAGYVYYATKLLIVSPIIVGLNLHRLKSFIKKVVFS